MSKQVCLQWNVRGQTMPDTTQSSRGQREYRAHSATNQQTMLKPFVSQRSPELKKRSAPAGPNANLCLASLEQLCFPANTVAGAFSAARGAGDKG